ncbi:MAG: TetR/AcrR family transcriptional regulator [Acidobacteria bacterium]|nr:TetR/AcrR family transcriptional regulator [Acidobacteriota bacterium]
MVTEPRVTGDAVERLLEVALALFSKQGFRGTSIREIATHAGLSIGNVYHHFANKEALFETLIERYWARLLEPELPINQLFARAGFPEELDELAAAIEAVVRENAPYVKLIYIDVVEFEGKHIRAFYQTMAERFERVYREPLERRRQNGEFGDIDPMVAAMVTVRWLFYFYTVENCFGVRNHLGMDSGRAVSEFIRLIKLGLLPRPMGDAGS